MKHTLLTLIAALGLVTSAGAQNLLTNGDFESGALSPWVGGSVAPDPSGGFFATTTGSLSQTVPTVAGKSYFVSADVLITAIIAPSASLTATPSAGGAADGTRSVSAPAGTPGFIRTSLLFTASSASTTITFSIVPFPGFVNSLTVDDATMLEIEPSKLAGKYSGTNAVTLSIANPELTNKVSRKVTALITEENRIYLLDGAQAVFTGVILNEGPFDLSSPLAPQASGTAKIRGKRIELEFNSNSLPALESNGTPLPNTVTNKVVLTRK